MNEEEELIQEYQDKDMWIYDTAGLQAEYDEAMLWEL